MPLTDTKIRQAKPTAKPARLYDERGLYLEISPSGSKLWRQKYRFAGKEKRLALGAYPDVGLSDARRKRDDARKLIAEGIDPSEHKKIVAATAQFSANDFESVAREWFSMRQDEWADSHAKKILARLENDIFPWIGKRSVADISAVEVLTTLKRISDRGAKDTALRAQQDCGAVFRFAIQTGRTRYNPIPDLRGALPTAVGGHFAALLEPTKVGELMRAIDGFVGSFPVKCALRLAPYLFVRPGELRQAKWADIDSENAEWRFHVSKTTKIVGPRIHIVPLAKQVMAVLDELRPLTGGGEYLFPGARDRKRPMSDAAVNAALRRMGYDTRSEITGHGFRAMARTILHEQLGVAPEVIEHQLAHKVPDALGSAYNRTKFLSQRVQMMQLWADYLDKLKAGAEVLQMNGRAA